VIARSAATPRIVRLPSDTLHECGHSRSVAIALHRACRLLTCGPGWVQGLLEETGGDSSVTDEDSWPRFKTKEAAQEITARCHAMERQTMVHWRAVKMEDGSWIVAAYKDSGWIQPSGLPRPYARAA